MIFHDRSDAGKSLAIALKEFNHAPNTTVIALPRGGVVVGFEIASKLNLPLDIVCPRKIGAPFNPELAIGAITETGDAIFSEKLIQEFEIPQEYLQLAIKHERQVAKERLDKYRKGMEKRHLKGSRVILVDDGLATGATMMAAIKTLKAEQIDELIVAIPVGSLDALAKVNMEANRVICLITPEFFYAVGQFYENFDQTSDEEVIDLLKKRINNHHL